MLSTEKVLDGALVLPQDFLESSALESSALESSALESSALESSAEESSAEESSAEESSAEESSAEESSALESSALESSALESSALESSALESSALESSALESSALESSALESSALESSALESSALESSAEESYCFELYNVSEPFYGGIFLTSYNDVISLAIGDALNSISIQGMMHNFTDTVSLAVSDVFSDFQLTVDVALGYGDNNVAYYAVDAYRAIDACRALYHHDIRDALVQIIEEFVLPVVVNDVAGNIVLPHDQYVDIIESQHDCDISELPYHKIYMDVVADITMNAECYINATEFYSHDVYETAYDFLHSVVEWSIWDDNFYTAMDDVFIA